MIKLGMSDDDAGQADPQDTRPASDGDKPVGYWAVKIIVILAIAGLAGVDLTVPDASIPTVVYALLGALAGGPEIFGLFQGAAKR